MHWTWYVADTADFGWKWINNFVTAAACFSPKPWAKSKMNFKTFWLHPKLDFEFWLFDHTFTWSSPIAIEVSKGYPSIHRVIAVAMLPESHPSHPHPTRGPRALDSLCFAGVVWVAFLVFFEGKGWRMEKDAVNEVCLNLEQLESWNGLRRIWCGNFSSTRWWPGKLFPKVSWLPCVNRIQ